MSADGCNASTRDIKNGPSKLIKILKLHQSTPRRVLGLIGIARAQGGANAPPLQVLVQFRTKKFIHHNLN
jgi:hypothetical protein